MARYSSPLLSELLRTILNKRITIRYPFAPVELPEGYRVWLRPTRPSAAGVACVYVTVPPTL